MRNVTVNSIGDYIREQREQAKISMRQLAATAGVSNPYLSQIERGLRKPSADILQQIAKGLRISAEALYVQAGILDDRPADSGVRSALLADPEVSERQKQVLIEIYESFRRENIAARESAQAEAAQAEAAQAEQAQAEAVALASGEPALADGAPGAEESFLAGMTPGTLAEAEALAEAESLAEQEIPGAAGQTAPTIRPDSASD
jgi:transcriptional regulator with XRE-family HTH domain